LPTNLDQVREICDRVAASLGLEVVEIEYLGGAGKQGRVLRIFIDKVWDGASTPVESAEEQGTPQVRGVTLEDCANVSREVSTLLDVEDAIGGGEYTLEVSSPGLDRKLTREQDYRRFVGSRIKLMTLEPIGVTEKSHGNRHFEGRLEKFENGKLTLDLTEARSKKTKKKQQAAGEKIEINFSNVEKANLVPEI
jgi:ribosome maturation factor RimP